MKYRILYKLRKDKDWIAPLADLQYDLEHGTERMQSLQESFADWKAQFKLEPVNDAIS